jgi:predicted TIM-barrel fold metal-dependent hydrolase
VSVDPHHLALADYHPRRAIRTPVTPVERAAVPAVDLHNHLGRWLSADGGWLVPDRSVLVDLMDRCNVAHIVNLDGRWGAELRANLVRYDEAYPDRFSTFAHVDWSVLAAEDEGAASRAMVDQLRASAAAGAKGLKVWKDLGLAVRDRGGRLVLPDDPRVAPVFAAAGELGLPVLIHVADPVAFFQPLDRHNERIEELAVHPDWWFGRPGLPSFDRLVDALESVVSGQPDTTFVGAHVGCVAEDLGRVSRMLSAYPNFHVDLGGRMAELGRQPRAARRLVLDHPEQVLFGTDQFPVDEVEYHRWFRFLESDDECFGYAPEDEPPPSGRWDVSALDLPPSVLPALYADNARRLLGR